MVQVQQVMTRNVECCLPSDVLSRAAQIMWERDCGCVPVVDDARRVVGMITDRDICMSAYTRGAPLHEIRVEDAMAKHVFTVRPEDALARLERLMQEFQIRRVPVVDESGGVVGIVSLSDIARAAAREVGRPSAAVRADEVATTLSTIAKPRVPRDSVAPRTLT